jgi:predicted kinase
MVIFMSGFPFAGKSYVVKLLKEKIELTVIDPKEYRTLVEDYDSRSEEDRRDINISAWQCALESLTETLKSAKSEEKIVLDTTCATEQMIDYFKMARKKGHKVVTLFVNSNLSLCRERAGKEWITEEVVSKYKSNFDKNLHGFKNLSDLFLVINNNGETPDLSKVIEKINAC